LLDLASSLALFRIMQAPYSESKSYLLP